MTFAPDRRVLGAASLTITTATGTRTVTLTHEGSAYADHPDHSMTPAKLREWRGGDGLLP